MYDCSGIMRPSTEKEDIHMEILKGTDLKKTDTSRFGCTPDRPGEIMGVV